MSGTPRTRGRGGRTPTATALARLRAYESPNVTFMAPDGSWPIVWERARGAWVWDVEGRRYLDLTAAFGVAAAGHANPRVVAAARRQLGWLPHAMGDVHPHRLKAELAQELSRLTFERWSRAGAAARASSPVRGKTVFGNSGFEAVEAALKTALLATGKPGVIAFEGAYHGLGYGALNPTARDLFRRPFLPQLAQFAAFVPFPVAQCLSPDGAEEMVDAGRDAGAPRGAEGMRDAGRGADALRGAKGMRDAGKDAGAPRGAEGMRDAGRDAGAPRGGASLAQVEAATRRRLARGDIGAILVEPVQGRGGIRVPPPEFLPMLRRLSQEAGTLLILDEIYTGFGRTGRWFACEHWGVMPDLVCLGKALTGGFPLSACVGRADLMDAAWPRSAGEAIHTSTFLGNPVGCAMALAQIAEVRRRRLVSRSARLGRRLLEALAGLRGPDGVQARARGLGLMCGLELIEPNARPAGGLAFAVVKAMLRRGHLLLPEGEHGEVLAFTPPLTITEAQLDDAVGALAEVLRALGGQAP